jgi:hypothetical protein
MYAIVAEYPYDPAHPPTEEALAEMQAIRAQQPGYRGWLLIDTGDGRRLGVYLWDSPEEADAGSPSNNAAMNSISDQHFRPYLIGPGKRLGRGRVIGSDVSKM